MRMTITMLLHFVMRREAIVHGSLPLLLPSGRGMRGSHDHTFPLLRTRRTETMLAFTPSFQEKNAMDHGHKKGCGQISKPPPHVPAGREIWGGHDHTPLLTKRRMVETIVASPPTFWKWYENDHDHASPLCHEERGRAHGFLLYFLLGEERMG